MKSNNTKSRSPIESLYLATDPYDDNDHYFGNDENIEIQHPK